MRWLLAANTHFHVVFTAVAEQYSEVTCQGNNVRLGITMLQPHSLPQTLLDQYCLPILLSQLYHYISLSSTKLMFVKAVPQCIARPDAHVTSLVIGGRW